MAYRRTPRVQARLDGQRRAVLDAAADLLAARGYAACSIAAVASAAGISTGSVYTHVAGKNELVAEVFRELAGREVAAVRAAVDAHDTALARITAVVETFAGRARREPRRAYALLAEPVEAGVEALRLEFRLAFRAVLADAIEQGTASGELPPQDADVAAAALVGAVAEALVAPLAHTSGDEVARAVPALIEFARRAVGGDVRAYA